MPPTTFLVIAIPVLVFVTVALVAYAFATPQRSELQERLKAYGYDVNTHGGGDLSEPFTSRVLGPVGNAMLQLVRSLTPDSMRERAIERLDMAGKPTGLGTFLAMRLAGTLVVPALMLLPRLLARDVGAFHLLLAIILGYVGNRLPDIWLSFQIDGRRDKVRKALPDALDLIVVCVEAGYGLEAAIAKVTERTTGPLSSEFERMLGEIRLGKARRDALKDMSARIGEPDVQSFIGAIVQADQMGVSIADVLRVQSDAVRVRRRQRAEEKALQAPVKMLFPLFFFIFPVLMMVILTPAVIRMAALFGQMVPK